MRRVPPWVVVQHAATEGPGLLAGVLADAGVRLSRVRMDQGDVLPPVGGVGGAVVMGGAMGVHDTAEHPWLEDERRWLRDAVTGGLPVLGVCLGAQQLAAALGACVRTGDRPEVGVGRVALTAAGLADPVLGPEGAGLPVVHWHGDTFDLPPGSEHLAASDRYANQAFRLGRHVYGMQFHLEVDDELASAWAPDLPPGVVLDAVGRRVVEAVGRRVLGRFVALALGRSNPSAPSA